MTRAQTHPGLTIRQRRARKRSRKWFFAGLGLATVLAISAAPLALFLADPLLTIRDPIGKADVIVVLGGDGPSRATRAAGLWKMGVAPKVLVSGDGDCYWIREAMVDQGVDRNAIAVECQSGTTWENALVSSPILKQMNVRSAVLVTSWYHSRRAMASFEAASTDIHWMSIPVEPRHPLEKIACGPDGIQIMKEYQKKVWFAIRHILGLESTRVPAAFPSREART
jgi:uncharacterized SAM-binding protein YcdF (DUF218 family)